MAKLDPVPLPYGGLQYYQVHYILDMQNNDNHDLLARCEPIMQGRFKNKKVVGVKWIGMGGFSDTLQADAKLTDMLKEVLIREGEVRIDPQEDHIRIHGKWVHEDKLAFSETMFEIADRIAMHIRTKFDRAGS
jgi:hypothetical protein